MLYINNILDIYNYYIIIIYSFKAIYACYIKFCL